MWKMIGRPALSFVNGIRGKILIILFCAFLMRLGAMYHYESSSESLDYVGYDESVYYSLACNMIQASPSDYTLEDAPLFFQDYRIWYIDLPLFIHPPLFAWTLMAFVRIAGNGLIVGRFLNVLLGTLSVYISYLLGRRISERVGILSALFLCLSPLHIQLSAFVLMEMMLAIFVCLFFLLLIKVEGNGSTKNSILCGVVLGLGMLTKYTMILVLPALIFYLFNGRVEKKNGAFIISSGFMVAFFWIAWNLATYDIPTFINTWVKVSKYGNPSDVPFYAYASFLPVVAPFTIISYLSFLVIWKEKDTYMKDIKIGLVFVIFIFMIFHFAHPIKDLRFILPALPPLAVLGAEWLVRRPSRFFYVVLAAIILTSVWTDYVILSGGYYWYLDFWHYGDWYIHFFGFLK